MINPLEEALKTIQAAVRERYGDGFTTEGGAGTVTIAHDRIEITAAGNRVAADEVEGVVAELERR